MVDKGFQSGRCLRRVGEEIVAAAEHEMLRTFNCGVGMVAVIAPDAIDAVTTVLAREGETVVRLGEVIAVKDGPRTVCSGRLDLVW